MWNLLKRKDEECARLRNALEEAAMKLDEGAGVEALMEELTAEERKHIELCGACREAAQDLAATRELFRGIRSFADEDRPWFAARVMAAIASRERELAQRISAWTEFPRFASRLAWVTSIVLLAATTWFYESIVRAPKNQLNGTQESIFETQQPTPPDDTLISKAGDVL